MKKVASMIVALLLTVGTGMAAFAAEEPPADLHADIQPVVDSPAWVVALPAAQEVSKTSGPFHGFDVNMRRLPRPSLPRYGRRSSPDIPLLPPLPQRFV